VALGSCGGDADRGAGVERPLVLGYSAELQTLNPLISTDQNANELIDFLLFTPLVRYDSAYRVTPGLAESWELSPQGVHFHLVASRWQDGEPVTAEDVKFTFDLAKNPDVASPLAAAYLAEVSTAEVVGPLDIRFTFTHPHSQPLEDFVWPPVPRHILEGVPPDELARHPFGRSPVGNGPYRLVSWDVNQQLVFEADPDYPAALGGPPGFTRVVYRILPESTSLLAELFASSIDVDGPLTPSGASKFEGRRDVRLRSFPWRQFSYIGWNGVRPPLDRPEVRRALTMAIDREAIVRTALQGFGEVASGVIPPWHRYAPALAPLPYAPDSAVILLRRLGWRDSDGDGILDREGRPFRFTLLANQRNPLYGDVAQIVQAQLRRVGVQVDVRLLEWQTMLSLHRARDYDAVLTNWVLDNFRVDPRPLFHSDQVGIPGSANRASYANPVADSLMDLGVRTMDDSAAAAIWSQFSRVLQRDQPLTFLFWQHELAGVSARLKGVRMDARGELVTLPRWRRVERE